MYFEYYTLMRSAKKHLPIIVFGLLSTIVFGVAIVLAYRTTPEGFSPLTHWVSDLGNPDVNPAGEKYFNYGCILVAFFFILFDLALCDIKTHGKRRLVLLALSEVFGVISASALVGLALFHAGQSTVTHLLFASAVLFFASTFFLGTVNSLKEFGIVKNTAVLYLFFGVFLAGIVALVFFQQTIGEWISVGLLILYLAYFSTTMFIYLIGKKTL